MQTVRSSGAASVEFHRRQKMVWGVGPATGWDGTLQSAGSRAVHPSSPAGCTLDSRSVAGQPLSAVLSSFSPFSRSLPPRPPPLSKFSIFLPDRCRRKSIHFPTTKIEGNLTLYYCLLSISCHRDYSSQERAGNIKKINGVV